MLKAFIEPLQTNALNKLNEQKFQIFSEEFQTKIKNIMNSQNSNTNKTENLFELKNFSMFGFNFDDIQENYWDNQFQFAKEQILESFNKNQNNKLSPEEIAAMLIRMFIKSKNNELSTLKDVEVFLSSIIKNEADKPNNR